jgi:phosphopantothenate synthetase
MNTTAIAAAARKVRIEIVDRLIRLDREQRAIEGALLAQDSTQLARLLRDFDTNRRRLNHAIDELDAAYKSLPTKDRES